MRAPWQSTHAMAVLGTGHALPGPAVSTATLIDLMAERFGFARVAEAATIARRMAIGNRHICRDFAERAERPRAGAANADLAAGAIMAALGDANLAVDDIGYLITHTATPDQPLPPGSALVADRIGYSGPHLELRQACTGFANALMVAHGLLVSPDARPVVIAGSETGSLFFDPARMAQDAGQIINMIQMGDGAGAIVLAPSSQSGARLRGCWFGAIGLGRAPGIQRHHAASEFAHDFAAIAAQGSTLFDAGAFAAARYMPIDQADFIMPHQVSGRIGRQAAQHFGLPAERFFVNADQRGNTGSAAIWIALSELRAAHCRPGQTVVALGAEASKFMYGGFVYEHG